MKLELNEEFFKDAVARAMDQYEDELYVYHIYNIVKSECAGMDAIYSDYIQQIVGIHGLHALLEARLLEGCGTVNGRQLYVLCENN